MNNYEGFTFKVIVIGCLITSVNENESYVYHLKFSIILNIVKTWNRHFLEIVNS